MASSFSSSRRTPSPVDLEKVTLTSVSPSTSPTVKLHKTRPSCRRSNESVSQTEKAKASRSTKRPSCASSADVDWNLTLLMGVAYGPNYLDKTALSYASAMGLQKDIGLVGDNYQQLSGQFHLQEVR